jgi:hypothetical protein
MGLVNRQSNIQYAMHSYTPSIISYCEDNLQPVEEAPVHKTRFLRTADAKYTMWRARQRTKATLVC